MIVSGEGCARCVWAAEQGDKIMAVMMRSMLDVADNSGARKLQMILPLGGSTGLVAASG